MYISPVRFDPFASNTSSFGTLRGRHERSHGVGPQKEILDLGKVPDIG